MSEVSNKRFVHFNGTKQDFIDGNYDDKYQESIVFINENGDETSSSIYTHGEYYGQGGVIIKGDADNSAVLKLKGEYEGYSNKAISQTSIAIGASTTAGLKGWYYSKIDFSKNQITLSDKQPYAISSVLIGGSWSSGTPNISIGDKISIVNDSKYDYCGTVKSISENIITLVDSLPFSKISSSLSFNNLDDWSIYIPDKPDAGIIDFGGGALAEGSLTKSTNIASHAEGIQTHAYGQYSHTEGRDTKAGYAAHAEGRETEAKGEHSHAEGGYTQARGNNSHAEGKNTISDDYSTHTEGYGTVVSIDENHTPILNDSPSRSAYSHAEGNGTLVRNHSSHAEGMGTTVLGYAAHAEGLKAKASGNASHAEGRETEARGNNSHAEGALTIADDYSTHTEGYGTVVSIDESIVPTINDGATNTAYSHAEGNGTLVRNHSSHAEGKGTIVLGHSAHAEGLKTTAAGNASHAEGNKTTASGSSSHAEGIQTTASEKYSHAEGSQTTASGEASHAEGNQSTASGSGSHAEGGFWISSTDCSVGGLASGLASHAEGVNTTASGKYSHAEGQGNIAQGNISHAQGRNNIASGSIAFVCGDNNKSNGFCSFAGGQNCENNGKNSISYGLGLLVDASTEYCATFGKYNTNTDKNTIFCVGNGTSSSTRSNAMEILQNGDVFIKGTHYASMPTKIYNAANLQNDSNNYKKIPTSSGFERIVLNLSDWSASYGQFIYYNIYVSNLYDGCTIDIMSLPNDVGEYCTLYLRFYSKDNNGNTIKYSGTLQIVDPTDLLSKKSNADKTQIDVLVCDEINGSAGFEIIILKISDDIVLVNSNNWTK